MITSQEANITGVRIKANVPWPICLLHQHLRTMTSGRGQFSMEFSTLLHVRTT